MDLSLGWDLELPYYLKFRTLLIMPWCKRSFSEGELDADLQQVDLRKTNSWR
jgi:hypothetical protein